MINHILLTKHSINRGYDRLSANSDELLVITNQAYTNGNRKSDFKGKFRKYLDTKSKEYPLNCFITLEEYRNQKIEKILE